MSAGAIAYGPEVVARIAALCEGDPTREVCGYVVRRGSELEVIPMPNVADQYHGQDPEHFPRTSRDSYLIDPKAHLRLERELEAWGGQIVAVWHSHVEVGAYFSRKDREDAVVDGIQLMPGAEYLVLGVKGGRVTEARRFRWEGGAFVESELGV